MRMSDIFKGVLQSNGGSIIIGGSRVDGVNVNYNDNGSFTMSTITSELESSGLRIGSNKTSAVYTTKIDLVATADVEFDTYEWTISGNGSFVGGISTGKNVSIEALVTGSCIVTVTATKGEAVSVEQKSFYFIDGLFSDSKLIGVTDCDSLDAMQVIVDGSVTPDNIIWNILSVGTLNQGPGALEATAYADESGADMMISATLQKSGYVDRTINHAIAVDLSALSGGGGAIVERPAIIDPNGEEINAQVSVKISPFHGINTQSSVRYQVDSLGLTFVTPIIDNTVIYSTEFGIDPASLVANTTYILRVQVEDDLGNVSAWSDTVEFSYLSVDTTPSVVSKLKHYWAMNSQDPVDYVSGRNGVTTGCWVETGGHFDNFITFNGSSSYVSVADFPLQINNYSIGVSFTCDVTDSIWRAPLTIEDANGVNKSRIAIAAGILYITSNSVNLTLSISHGARYTVTMSRNNVLVNGVNIGTLGGTLSAIFTGDKLIFGSHISDTTSDRVGFFSGSMDEAAFWEEEITEQEMIDWHTKTERPHGKVGFQSLPSAAIDHPYILNDGGANLEMTPYFGKKTFSQTEYEVASDDALNFNIPILKTIFPASESIVISDTLTSNTFYKIRARYIDIEGNKSQWSREKIFKFSKFPVANYEFLLTVDKNSVGFLNVTQVGLPTINAGACDFLATDYFKFDRVDISYGTISLWARFDDLDATNGGAHTMMIGGDPANANLSYFWYYVSTNVLRIYDASSAPLLVSNSFTGVPGAWYHFVLEFDLLETRIQVDLVEMGSGSAGTFGLELIGHAYGNGYDFVGGQRGVRVYDRLLTAQEKFDLFHEFD